MSKSFTPTSKCLCGRGWAQLADLGGGASLFLLLLPGRLHLHGLSTPSLHQGSKTSYMVAHCSQKCKTRSDQAVLSVRPKTRRASLRLHHVAENESQGQCRSNAEWYEQWEARFMEDHLGRLASTALLGKSNHITDCSITKEQGQRIWRWQSLLLAGLQAAVKSLELAFITPK